MARVGHACCSRSRRWLCFSLSQSSTKTKRKKIIRPTPNVPTSTCPTVDAQAQPDRATRQPRSACHPPVPGPLANSFINASWWFFRRSFLIPAAIYHPPRRKQEKKKGAEKKKNQPTLLRGRSGAQQPPALCPTAGLIRLLSSGKRLIAHRFSRQKDGQRAVRLSSGGVCLVPGGSRLSFLEQFSHCIKWSIFFLFLSFFPFFLLVVAFLFLHSGCASFSSPHRFGCCTAFFYLSGYKFLKAEVKKRTVTRCRLALEAVQASRPKLDFASPWFFFAGAAIHKQSIVVRSEITKLIDLLNKRRWQKVPGHCGFLDKRNE